MTKRVIYSSIGAIWLLAALISFLPVSMDLHKPQGQQQLMVMEEQFDDEFSNSISDSMDLMANSDETRMMMGAGALVISSEDTVETVSVLTDPIASLPSPQCALDLTPTYAIVSSCISFYLPCLVMLAIYSRLFFYAKMHVQNIKAVTRPVILLGRFEPDPNQQATSSEVAQTPASTKKQKKKRRHYQSSSANSTSQQNSYHVSDHKAAITLGIIMGVFLICWVPFFCVNIVAAFCKTCIPPIVFKILTWLGYSNSAFNPIIYSIFNLDFRLAFQKILTVKTRSFCCHRYDDYDYEQRSRGNSNGGPAAAAQGSHSQYRMDHLRNQQQQQQLQTNGHQSGANRMEESNRHPLLPSSAHADDDPQTDHHSSEDGHSTVLMVSASSGHIISPANINSIKPHHVKTVTSIRQDSGQQLLIAEKVVWLLISLTLYILSNQSAQDSNSITFDRLKSIVEISIPRSLTTRFWLAVSWRKRRRRHLKPNK